MAEFFTTFKPMRETYCIYNLATGKLDVHTDVLKCVSGGQNILAFFILQANKILGYRPILA